MSGTEPRTPASLADALVACCVAALDAFVVHHAPGGRLPRVFAGHAVGADVRADLVFTLGHLHAAGEREVAGRPIDDWIVDLLRDVDGVATHSFFSYRIAETLLDRGAFADNPLLADLDDRQRAEVEAACDSSSFVPLLDAGQLPRNYAGVLSRCERARSRLGLLADESSLESLLVRLRALLAENPRHALDDSNDGSGRYDIYTADVWLFCEPLADLIGAEWRAGLADALALVEAVVGPDGSAIPWGRSTGVLSIALTVELAAAALDHGLGDDPGAWLRRGCDAADRMPAWFDADGVINAHRHRDQDRYRGPARRLQLTFDILGKLAYAARVLRALDPATAATHAADRRRAYPTTDRLLAFDDRTRARLWAVRRPGIAFALPMVGAARSHYLPAPVRPGCLEVPVDEDLPTWTPLVVADHRRYTAGGLPDDVEHGEGTVTARWDRLVPSTDTFATERPAPLAGSRRSTFRVEGRSLVLDDELTFAATPSAVAIAIPELAARPLVVELEPTLGDGVASVIDVDGVAEWQTSWSSIARVHQLDLDPATTLGYRVRVTPKLRVGSTAHGHHYDRCLYRPLRDRVVDRRAPIGWDDDGSVEFDDIDVLHLHWPEWVAFDDLDEHARIAERLDDHDVPVVWTAHNLTPHAKQPDRFDPVYALWAQRVAAVIHHSAWGRDRMRARYEFAPGVEHVVIPHGHFGSLWAAHTIDRAAAEAALGLAPCALRIGIVGAPRAEKRIRDFVDGFVACDRTDVQLAVWSLAPDEVLPDDPRIVVAETYRSVDVATYARQLSACDVLALPFDPDGEMLATGTVADAVGLGIPVLGTTWGFLDEHLGAARIDLGAGRPDEVAAAITRLDVEALHAARAATEARRPALEWGSIADRTFAVLEAARLAR